MNELLMLFALSLYITSNLVVIVGWFIMRLSPDSEAKQIYSFIIKLYAFLTVLMIICILFKVIA
jgi:hypothetical protein